MPRKKRLFIFIMFYIFFGSTNILPARAVDMININTASPVEFDTLPGIGPAKAQAIIYYRAQNGSFRTIEEIMNVSGIGPTTFDGLKDSITVDEENEPPPINAAVCGNGAVETGEECDDGNAVSGDGCGAGCQTEEAPDSQTSPQAAPARGEEGGARPGEVVINEFVSDPADGEVEWIELYNKLSRDVDLAEWTIEEGSGAKTTLAGVLAGSGAGKFLAFEKPKGSLNNAGDIIILRDAGGELIDQVAYGNWDDGNKDNNAPAAGDPNSVARKADGYNTNNNANDFKLTTVFTKGSSNIMAGAEEEEEISASERPGYDYSDDIIISEIMPDPAGSDEEGEWIELYNRGGTVVNMLDWRLDDEEGGSKPYRFSAGWLFAPGKFRLIERSESKLALNNPGGAVRLFNADGDLIDEAIYGAASEGEVYARGENGKWFWSTATTPGERNLIAVADSVAVRAMAATGRALVQPSAAAEPSVVEITLEKIQEMEVGDAVKVSGTVAVLPGILGSQYFYIVGSPGVQIYSYKKDFPTLAVGDYITVTGELSQTYGEWRVKTKTAADMEVVGPGEPPAPTEIACDKISEEAAGQLVAIAGEITDRKSSTVYFDDGTGEIIIYIKAATGIALSNLKEGRRASITGLVGRTSSGVRVMPRSGEDIVYEEEAAEGETRQVLGEVAASDEWEIGVRDKKFELFKYLLIVAGAVILVLGGLLFRMRRR
jgi:competence ComEA-like helix-hairpin-helix protein